MKFRKKPVVIEAEQFDGTPASAERLCLLYASVVSPEFEPVAPGDKWTGRLCVQTPEGTIYASPGDWIITGVKGERYPCKPDIFAATYEAADGPGSTACIEKALIMATGFIDPENQPPQWSAEEVLAALGEARECLEPRIVMDAPQTGA